MVPGLTIDMSKTSFLPSFLALPTPYLLGLVVLKFNVQAVLNTDFHFDRVVDIRWHPIRVDPDILFMNEIGKTTRYGNTHKVSEEHASVS